MEWLAEQGLVADTDEVCKYEKESDTQISKLLDAFKKFFEPGMKILEENPLPKELDLLDSAEVKEYFDTLTLHYKVFSNQMDARVRMEAARVDMLEGVNAIPLLGGYPELLGIQDYGIQNMAKVILKTLPQPSEATSWEEIIDFVNNQDARMKRTKVQRWIRKVVRKGFEYDAALDELEERLFEYEEYLNIHNIKFSQGVLEALIITTAEVLENIIKLNFSKAAKTLFSINKQAINLMEAELKAPGREFAYIYKTKKYFKS